MRLKGEPGNAHMAKEKNRREKNVREKREEVRGNPLR